MRRQGFRGEQVNSHQSHPKPAQSMHNNVKIPDRIVPVKLIRKNTNDKNKKYQQSDQFKKIFSIHSVNIITFLRKNLRVRRMLLRTISEILP